MSSTPIADQALREIARRLLGNGEDDEPIAEEPIDPWSPAQAAAWAATATYLDGRIQSVPDEKPGRTPDLSTAAAAAMRAVLMEVGAGLEPSSNLPGSFCDLR